MIEAGKKTRFKKGQVPHNKGLKKMISKSCKNCDDNFENGRSYCLGCQDLLKKRGEF